MSTPFRVGGVRVIPNTDGSQVNSVDLASKNNSHAVKIKSPDTLSGDVPMIMPSAVGVNPGYPLLYDASGNVIARQPRGNTTVAQMADSTSDPATGNLAKFDANGNIADAGFGTPIPVADGGTGTATPGLVAGSNVTITGSWPNQTIAASGGGGGGGISLGTYASLTSPTAAGTAYKCTDSPYLLISDGTNWHAFLDGGDPVVIPPSSGWSWDQQGASSINQTYGFLSFVFAPNAGQWRHYYRTSPSTPYTISVRMRKLNWSGATANETPDGIGVCFRVAGGQFIAFYCLTQSGNDGLLIEKWNGDNSFSGSYNSLATGTPAFGAWQFAQNRDLWLQVSDNGTNLIWRWGIDGSNWYQLDSQARGAFLTGGPTEVGICCRNGQANEGYTVDVFGWG